MTDPDGFVTSYTYDEVDRRIDEIVPVSAGASRTTRSDYDLAGQLTKVTKGFGSANPVEYATYGYTPNGQQDWVMDANGNQTDYQYDLHDRLDKLLLPHPNTGSPNGADYEQYSYDPNGNVTAKRKRSGKTLTFVFDALNRESTKTVPANGSGQYAYTVTTTYDLAGLKRTVAVNTPADTLTWNYDAAGRTESVADSLLGTVSYLYDAASNRTRVTWAGTPTYYVSYEYDALNRMTAVRENGTTLFASYGYDTLSRRTSLSLGNGAGAGYQYEADDDLSQISHSWSGGGTLAYGFTHNRAHQITSQ